jgi:hypothetical protein
MKIFKSIQDLKQLDHQHPAFEIVRKHLGQMSDLYPLNGFLTLIEKTDMGKPIVLQERTLNLTSVFWEGVAKRDGHYHAVLLLDNEYALEFFVPDTDWLNDAIRKNLNYHLV